MATSYERTEADAALDRRVRPHPILGPLPATDTVRVTFDGQPLAARADEPIAAALLAAGVRVFRTMPGAGEARGGYCMVGRCSDCLMIVDGELNVRACVTPVRDGMRIATQHGLGDWEAAAATAPKASAG